MLAFATPPTSFLAHFLPPASLPQEGNSLPPFPPFLHIHQHGNGGKEDRLLTPLVPPPVHRPSPLHATLAMPTPASPAPPPPFSPFFQPPPTPLGVRALAMHTTWPCVPLVSWTRL